MQLLTGNLLVASADVNDPVYSRGVCLIVHHDEENVIGVMLNRPMQPNPAALIKMLSDNEPQPDRALIEAAKELPQTAAPLGMVHFGGPLSGPVVAIHPMSQFGEAETGQGIYVAAQKEHLEELVRAQPCPYRLIVGHLGWETEQLQSEFDTGQWHLLPATVDVVFCNAQEMWPGLIRRATARSMAHWLDIPDVANAFELN